MTIWTLTALGLVVASWLIPWLMERQNSFYAVHAALAGNIVFRLTISAVLAWVTVHLLSQDDSLHRWLAVPVALVLALTLFKAMLGIAILLGRDRT